MSIPGNLETLHSWVSESIQAGNKSLSIAPRIVTYLIERIGRLGDDNQRLTDLVRWCRSELFDEKLIDEEEFARLVADSDNGQRVARLEGYDRIRNENAALKNRKRELSTNLKALQDHVGRCGKALNDAGLHGHYNLFQKFFGEDEYTPSGWVKVKAVEKVFIAQCMERGIATEQANARWLELRARLIAPKPTKQERAELEDHDAE